MELKILELNLRNFKGIKDLKLTPGGSNLNVYGENATGKTTIMDAFLWLLFDKDSQNSSNFNIKTLDKNGNVIHGLEHEVSAILVVDENNIELQKIYKEKWTKKRGQPNDELTGHTTDYFINGVPKKMSEYKDYLSQIINEDTFKIITNPLYFNRSLDWKKRRAIAMEICGEVDYQEVIDQDEKLEKLKSLLNDKSIDDLKSEMAFKRKKLNEELKSIPYRIDELSRERVDDVDVDALNKEKKELQKQIKVTSNSTKVDYDLEINRINSKIETLENESKKIAQDAVKKLRESSDELSEEISNIKKSYYSAKSDLDKEISHKNSKEADVLKLTKNIENLRDDFKEIASNEFDESSTICPTCKQNLPDDDIKKLIEVFNIEKQTSLNDINEKGKTDKSTLIITKEEIVKSENAIAELSAQVEMLAKIIEDKQNEYLSIENQIKNTDVNLMKEYAFVQSEINALIVQKDGIDRLIAKDDDNTNQLKELELQINDIDKQLAKIDLAAENKKRIKELMDREQELSRMILETEGIEFLCDEFVITKSNLLEDKLNSKFELVKFKLFDVQVNGGINETFVTTVDGVPFEDLNNAMKINAGLDIINTLADYYNFKAPIFIDNRESVNQIIEVKSQVINLIVSKDKKLRVEVEQ